MWAALTTYLQFIILEKKIYHRQCTVSVMEIKKVHHHQVFSPIGPLQFSLFFNVNCSNLWSWKTYNHLENYDQVLIMYFVHIIIKDNVLSLCISSHHRKRYCCQIIVKNNICHQLVLILSDSNLFYYPNVDCKNLSSSCVPLSNHDIQCLSLSHHNHFSKVDCTYK